MVGYRATTASFPRVTGVRRGPCCASCSRASGRTLTQFSRWLANSHGGWHLTEEHGHRQDEEDDGDHHRDVKSRSETVLSRYASATAAPRLPSGAVVAASLHTVEQFCLLGSELLVGKDAALVQFSEPLELVDRVGLRSGCRWRAVG